MARMLVLLILLSLLIRDLASSCNILIIIHRPSMDKNIELLDNQISTLKRKIDFNCNAIYQQQK